jgi:DNA-binding MarR family transcriptional regulator
MEQDKVHDYLSMLEDVFGELVRRLHMELGQHLIQGITASQFVVLNRIKKKGRMTVSEIADGIGVSLSAITAVSDRLHKAGMLQRRRDENDRRLVWLENTPEGDRVVETINAGRCKVVGKYFGQLPPEDFEKLIEIHEKLLVIMRREAAEKHKGPDLPGQ